MQHLWTVNLGWDETVPLNIKNVWNDYINELKLLCGLRVPRKVIGIFPHKSLELHGFCDASLQAYGAVIYITTIDNIGNRETYLLCAKSRVAPLKTISLPRLELCGAVLLARLYAKVIKSLTLNIKSHFLCTDSTIVVNWISQHPSKWKTFTANRVSEIQTLTEPSNWHHVNSQYNPADIISRGMLSSDIKNCRLWWHGPTWLHLNSTNWPVSKPYAMYTESELETRNVVLNCSVQYDELPIFSKCSSFAKLTRILSYCLRFFNNCR